MTEVKVSTTRIAAIVAVLLAVMMIGVPTGLLGSGTLGAVSQAAAAEENDRQFVVGVIDMTISTLNPNKYTMSAEGMAIFPCYSTLIQYDDNDEIIGDLAYDWLVPGPVDLGLRAGRERILLRPG
jgi:ABC-type transport system substrate-binding protein